MNALLITFTALAANALGAVMALPQAWKLARTRAVEGLSPAWAGVSVAMNGWWLAYALSAGVSALIPVSGLSIVLYGAMGVVLVRTAGRSALPSLGQGLAVGALFPLPFLVSGGWTVAGIAIGFGYGAQLAPAVIAAYRQRDLRGVAAGTWIIAFLEGALWLAYALLVRDPALIVGGVSGLVMATLILTRLAVTGHRPFRRAPLFAA